MPSYRQIAESMNVANDAIMATVKSDYYHDFASILSAIRYHGHSLDSNSEVNQLLDLWAIFEAVLDISNQHTGDRIQQICKYLVPLLKQKYIYSLFNQLANDIKNYNEDLYNQIVGDTETEQQVVKNVCEFTLLESNQVVRDAVLGKCNDFPLLKERISYYCDVLSTPSKVHAFVEKHAERVRWQIMRIYRNRNLIIHNGSLMPYLPLLIENLHSYVDDFLSYTIHNLAEDKNIHSMCHELFVKECRWNASFPRQKKAITADQVTDMLSI